MIVGTCATLRRVTVARAQGEPGVLAGARIAAPAIDHLADERIVVDWRDRGLPPAGAAGRRRPELRFVEDLADEARYVEDRRALLHSVLGWSAQLRDIRGGDVRRRRAEAGGHIVGDRRDLGVRVGVTERDSAGNMLSPPAPEMSAKLFDPIEEAKNPTCPTTDEVIGHHISATSDLKSGNVKRLAGNLPQAFADAWREQLHMKRTPVSAVVAQPFNLSSASGGPALDVTEFGANGCAFSRTIMPAAIFVEILKAAVGVEV